MGGLLYLTSGSETDEGIAGIRVQSPIRYPLGYRFTLVHDMAHDTQYTVYGFAVYCICYVLFVISEITVYTGARPDRHKVLILAEYRSGSTFTSELFNQNPEVSFK